MGKYFFRISRHLDSSPYKRAGATSASLRLLLLLLLLLILAHSAVACNWCSHVPGIHGIHVNGAALTVLEKKIKNLKS